MRGVIRGAYLVPILGLITGLPTASIGFADSAPSPPIATQPTVVVTVPGGLSGALFGQILEATFEVFTPPTESYQVRSGDTVCSILRARNYPPPCMPIVRALYRINPGLDQHADNLSPGELMSLPLFEVKPNRATASVPASTQSESQAETAEDVRLELEKTAKSAYAYFAGFASYKMSIPTLTGEQSVAIKTKLSTIPQLDAQVLNSESEAPAVLASRPGKVRPYLWKAKVESEAAAQAALSELYLALFNTGRLATRTEPFLAEDTYPSRILVRLEAWFGQPTLALDSILCDLNPNVCKRQKKPARLKDASDLFHQVAGFEPSPGVWSAKVGDAIVVPDVRIQGARTVSFLSTTQLQGKKKTISGQSSSEACAPNQSPCASFSAVAASEEIRRGVIVYDAAKSGDEESVSEKGEKTVVTIPILKADLLLAEQPLPAFSEIEHEPSYSFVDQEYKRLVNAIGQRLIAGTEISVQSNADEAGFDLDAWLKSINLVAPLDVNAHPVTIGVIDENIELHCAFSSAKMVGPGAPTTPLAPCTASPPTSQFIDLPEVTHGTHVLGMLAAHGDFVGLLDGMSWPQFYVRQYDSRQLGPAVVEALGNDLKAAVLHFDASVFNISWTYPIANTSDVIDGVIKQLDDRALFVVAAGNEELDADHEECVVFPACLAHLRSNVIAVVAVRKNPASAKFELLKESNFGAEHFDIAAPAENILSTVGVDQYGHKSGTSQAAPIVTAAAAYLFAKGRVSPQKVRQRLIYTSQIEPTLLDSVKGGVIDVAAALNTEFAFVRQKNGCSFRGRLLSADPDEVEIKLLESGSKMNVTLMFGVRRLYYRDDSDSYVILFNKRGDLKRETNATLPDASLQFENVTLADQKCSSPERTFRKVPLSDIADYIAAEE